MTQERTLYFGIKALPDLLLKLSKEIINNETKCDAYVFCVCSI